MYTTYFIAAALGATLSSPLSADISTETSIVPVHYSQYKHEHDADYAGNLENCTPTGFVCERSYYWGGQWNNEPEPEEPVAKAPDELSEKRKGVGEAIGGLVDILTE